jgi:hypothetical protein
MRQSPFTTPHRDYSGIFIAAVLLGTVVVVVALTMVSAYPASVACCIG